MPNITLSAPGIEKQYPIGFGWLRTSETINVPTVAEKSDSDITVDLIEKPATSVTIDGTAYSADTWFRFDFTLAATLGDGQHWITFQIVTSDGRERQYKQLIDVEKPLVLV